MHQITSQTIEYCLAADLDSEIFKKVIFHLF